MLCQPVNHLQCSLQLCKRLYLEALSVGHYQFFVGKTHARCLSVNVTRRVQIDAQSAGITVTVYSHPSLAFVVCENTIDTIDVDLGVEDSMLTQNTQLLRVLYAAPAAIRPSSQCSSSQSLLSPKRALSEVSRRFNQRRLPNMLQCVRKKTSYNSTDCTSN